MFPASKAVVGCGPGAPYAEGRSAKEYQPRGQGAFESVDLRARLPAGSFSGEGRRPDDGRRFESGRAWGLWSRHRLKRRRSSQIVRASNFTLSLAPM